MVTLNKTSGAYWMRADMEVQNFAGAFILTDAYQLRILPRPLDLDTCLRSSTPRPWRFSGEACFPLLKRVKCSSRFYRYGTDTGTMPADEAAPDLSSEVLQSFDISRDLVPADKMNAPPATRLVGFHFFFKLKF